jgi:YggT family protein
MIGLLGFALDAYSLVVLAAVIVSWLSLDENHPIVRLTARLTRPVLEPIRRVLPPFGGMDFSPMVLLFGLRLLRRVLGV